MTRTTYVIKSLLENAVREHLLPGLAVAINQNGAELFAGGFGFADANRTRAIDADTVFGAASLTKVVTAILLIDAAKKEQLETTDLVSKHYPELKCASNAPISLHHLLNHSAGFPGLSSRFYAANASNGRDSIGGVDGHVSLSDTGWDPASRLSTAADLVEFLNHVPFDTLGSPGDMMSYSNEGYCLLGGVLESIHDRRFSEIANTGVFGPLGMNRSSIGADRWTADDPNLATPLRASENGLKSIGFWEAPLFYPAGGLMTTARDLVALFSLLDGETGSLPRAQAKKMTSRPIPVPSRPSREFGYGYGLEIRQIAQKTLLWHTGQRAGVSAFAGRLVEDEVSVALLANISNAPLSSIAHAIFGTLLDLPELRWPPRFVGAPRGANNLTPLTGKYGSQEGFENRVVIKDNRLLLQTRGNHDAFVFSGVDFGTVGDQTFRFLNLQDGSLAPDALALDLRIFPRMF